MTYSGIPTNNAFVMNQEDSDVALSPGGRVRVFTAAVALKYGDAVYQTLAGYVDKNLESALYTSRFVGIVVGGSATNYEASTDAANLIGVQVAAALERVIVQVEGVCYANADATGILNGQPITAGRTTAGRVRGDMLYSCATTPAGLAIKAGASALVKAVNATSTLVAGIPGTTTAANLDMAALAGTVTNGKYNIYTFRVAANGTTVTSAMGTEASTLAGVLWPTGAPTVADLGCIVIHPTGTGNFVGGTTALDDATVIPNAVYYDFVRSTSVIGFALADGGAAGTSVLIRLHKN